MDATRSAGLAARLQAWAAGIGHELYFWNEWMRTRGLQWPADFAARMDPANPLDPWLAAAAAGFDQPGLRILDVGSGPLTSTGYVLPGRQVEVVPVDPLAAGYAALFARHGLVPPVPPRFAPAEDLTLFLEPASFDIVHCRNALDHSYDPLRGIEQMLAMARIGGTVMLQHFPDEAETEAYSGFHQFNFSVREGRFVIWNREAEVDVAAALRTPARVIVEPAEMVMVRIEKLGASPEVPAAEQAARLAGGMAGLVAALAEARMPG
ncbi:class I SAM-dependent methyltransferase [Siccirubricoccus sp. KC 17139]|uniref:Class I SAM-dependent methyltransferase n=1 Tax=Siccirubricoccus soli TaxID=2899147 RepID=A0ABT1DD76_9PROT|nr:methyltransferase domain-containing protein [Siccirubricoccus soli]MCO6419888.1 class I SAM-dependent methyltransferase [Siccirubricoccus soli]MCP2686023.1 class I SAM-dependent methyltransferase [Siccirubricoccus soli]